MNEFNLFIYGAVPSFFDDYAYKLGMAQFVKKVKHIPNICKNITIHS